MRENDLEPLLAELRRQRQEEIRRVRRLRRWAWRFLTILDGLLDAIAAVLAWVIIALGRQIAARVRQRRSKHGDEVEVSKAVSEIDSNGGSNN